MSPYSDPAAPHPLPLVAAGEPGASVALEHGEADVRREVLLGGVRLLTESVPGARSVAIGLWIPVGSRDEAEDQAGASHFLEHLLFKGTRRRSALDIARAFDQVGGESNGETSREWTDYWARVVARDAEGAIDVLVDQVACSRLDPRDVRTERRVILEELAMARDDPNDAVGDAFARAVFGPGALGAPVGGTLEAVRAQDGAGLRAHYARHYAPDNLIVTIAGHIGHARARDAVHDALRRAGWGGETPARPRARRPTALRPPTPAGDVRVGRDVEQAHLLVGGRALRAGDPRRAVQSVLMTLLGGGTSSRLFQEVRERRGLAYSTYAFDTAAADAGSFALYAGCAPESLPEVERILWGELEDVAGGHVDAAEVARVKGQLRGATALGLEDTVSRMARLARLEMLGRYLSVDEALARIGAVGVADVVALAGELARGARARAVVVPARGTPARAARVEA